MKNKKLLLALIALLLVCICTAGSFLYYQVSLQSVSSTSEVVSFEVKQGDSVSTVIEHLDEQDIIKSSFVSKLYARFHSLHNIKAGTFSLDKAWNTREVLEYLNDATNAGEDQVQITFREGIWAKDIAAALETKLGVSAQELLALWNDDTYLTTLIEKYEFLNEDILQDEVRVKLEGYLYPETYSFAMDATKEEITETFLDQFAKVYETIKADVSASRKSMQDIITMASMVQYEAKTEDDMYRISGVFQNRMDAGMTLGSSVTICYALYEEYEHAEDCEVNSDIESPYNTYKYSGLPIGPILNPGKTAILAAIHPRESDDLYFMADIYGDGTVYYAKTLEEHEANVNKYLR